MVQTLLYVNEHAHDHLWDGEVSPDWVRSFRPGDYPALTAGNGETVIESLDPSFILSAAAVLASGYKLTPDRQTAEKLHLSTREKEVAALLADGASNKVIARELDISVHTAKFHVTAVLDKLGARNRADAVAIALREGVVTL